MNERIRELEIEAIAYADSKVPVNDRYNDIYHSIVRGKFAELIAKEYIENCRDMFIVGSVSWNLLNEKLEHFGVE
jgi:hypothetical protein